jgi:hypothetical protein
MEGGRVSMPDDSALQCAGVPRNVFLAMQWCASRRPLPFTGIAPLND